MGWGPSALLFSANSAVLCELCVTLSSPPLPAYWIVIFLVLLIEPGFERSEIIRQRRGVHLALPGEDFQSVGPGFAAPHGEHAIQFFTGGLVSVDRAAV